MPSGSTIKKNTISAPKIMNSRCEASAVPTFRPMLLSQGSIWFSAKGSSTMKAAPMKLPITLNQALPVIGSLLGLNLGTALASHMEFMIFGALIVFFLIVEPLGIARLWAIGKEKLRLWPFPH